MCRASRVLFAKGLRRVGGVGVSAVIPALGFQALMIYCPAIRSAKQPPTASHISCCSCSASRLMTDFAGLQQIQDQQLHEVGFTLTGVAQDQDVGGGFVLISLVKINQNVAAIFVFCQCKSLWGPACRIVEGIEICHAGGGQHRSNWTPKAFVAAGIDTAEALLLTEQELVNIQFTAHQLRQNIGLEQLEGCCSPRQSAQYRPHSGAAAHGCGAWRPPGVATSCRLLSAVTVCCRSLVLELFMRFLLAAF